MKSFKNILFLMLTICVSNTMFAQVFEPVDWSFSSESIGNNQYELSFQATIDSGWYVYAQDLPPDGPVPTSFNFETPGIKQVGKIREIGKVKKGFDPIFEMEISKYANKVNFIATIEADKAPGKAEGYLTFMTCNDERCLPPEDVDFSFTLESATPVKPKEVETPAKTGGTGGNIGATTPSKPLVTKDQVKTQSLESSNDLLAGKYKKKPAKTNIEKLVKDKEPGQSIDLSAKTDKQAEDEEGEEESAEPGKKKKKKKKKVRRSSSSAQIYDPVEWKVEFPKTGGNEYEFIATCNIEDGWYVYSQDNSGDGPVPTSFEFEEVKGITWIDKAVKEEGDLKDMMDPVFDMQVKKYAHDITFRRKFKLDDPKGGMQGYLRFMTCNDERCLPPDEVPFNFNMKSVESAAGAGANLKGNELSGKIAHCGRSAKKEEKKSIWILFLLGVGGGLAALFTPCVFPMIPLTVSFFTKSSKDKTKGVINAVIYALSIIVIYVALGYTITAIFGADMLNILSTNVWFNLAFFALFVIFAISFFGYFELTLPNGLINKVDSMSDKGGLIGIFFMAFTLALVSFSCTGPIIGTQLVVAANGGVLGPVVCMFGFALALALPFALFAAFPGWLNSLPRSGGWLNTVKVTLGFIELIFALKFLSNADMVKQWGILPRELFILLWIILLVATALYLFGIIKFPHDSPIKKLGAGRIATGAFAGIFALLLAPGLFAKHMPVVGNLISGFPPPVFYNISSLWTGGDEEDKHHGIMDLEEGLAEAKRTGKPLLLDFTGWACVNCRRMEENVWPSVSNLIDQYTLVSLYVDEDIPLDKSERFEYEVNGKKKKVRTVGNKWSYLQINCFSQNSQPYYVLMNEKGELLAEPRGYTPDIGQYSTFLRDGLNNHDKGANLFSGL